MYTNVQLLIICFDCNQIQQIVGNILSLRYYSCISPIRITNFLLISLECKKGKTTYAVKALCVPCRNDTYGYKCATHCVCEQFQRYTFLFSVAKMRKFHREKI